VADTILDGVVRTAHKDQTLRRKSLCQLKLVIIDVLAESGEPRQDDGQLAVPYCCDHRSDASVRDDDIRSTHIRQKVVGLQVIHPLSIEEVGSRKSRAVLNQKLIPSVKHGNEFEGTLERLVVSAKRHQDQVIAPA
jgi:hypothetical protein